MDLPKNIALVDTPPSIASTRQQMSTNVKKINNTCISDFFCLLGSSRTLPDIPLPRPKREDDFVSSQQP
jgi:hypothetical protein